MGWGAQTASAMAESTDVPPPSSRAFSRVVPLAVAGGLLMEGLDSTIIATSLPQMARSLSVAPAYLSLAITSYLLSLAIFIPVSGWMADRFGARRVYCIAIAIFTISSGLCALSPNLGFLVAMRIVQGLGGAMMSPVARLILLRSFPKSQYLSATTYMTIPALIGPIFGPVLGGFITEYFSWHWIFLINIPIGIANILILLKFVDDIPPQQSAPFDFSGFLLVGAGLAMAQFGLECMGHAIIPVVWQMALVVGSVAMLFGYRAYARNHANPVLDLKLFRFPNFSTSILWGGLARLGSAGTSFLLPLFFQVGFGFDPIYAGTLVLVSMLGALFMRAGFASMLRLLGLRQVLLINGVLLATMLLGFNAFHAGSPGWLLMMYLFVFGFLRSVQFMSLNMLSYADLTGEMISKGSSLYFVGQRMSMSASVAVAAVVLSVASRSAGTMGEAQFHWSFAVLALLEALSLWGFWRLDPAAGHEVTHGPNPEK